MIGCSYRVLIGDAREKLRELPDASVHTIATSPPYWRLRDYGVRGQLGREATPEEYVHSMVEVMREARRVLRPDGTCWLNLGDSYVTRWGSNFEDSRRGRGVEERVRSGPVPPGLKEKDLVGIPWRVALALQADGWWLRTDIIWNKTNAQPDGATDRPTRSHEYVFLFTKNAEYFYDQEAVREPAVSYGRQRSARVQPPKVRALQEDGTHGRGGDLSINYERKQRNLRTVWSIATQPSREAHFAAYPLSLVRPCILAGTSEVGCCRLCGAPLARLVEKVRTVDGKPVELPPMKDQDRESPDTAQGVGHYRIATITTTVGWKATCRCPLGPPVPCTVLDLFAGTSTTGVVALELGRNYIGIEVNGKFVAISERRLAAMNPLFTRRLHEAP